MRHPLYAIAALTILPALAAMTPSAHSATLQPAESEPTATDTGSDITGLTTPAGARRITARFDFEPIPGDSIGLPPDWIRAQHDPPTRDRPGYPIWNRGEIDDTVSYTGRGSLRLDTEGGSASLLLDPGTVQVFPDADYAVVARVRTKDVTHARARLAARLLDQAGNAIPGSEVISPPVRTEGEWTHISCKVPGDFPQAISLQIELLLEQPGPDPLHPYAPFAIERQDYQGSAWFDDLAVVQIPRVEMWTDQPGNVFRSSAQPGVNVFVRDLVNEPLQIRYQATDAHGTVIDSETADFTGGRLEHAWSPKLDRFGYYRVSIDVLRSGVRIGGDHTALLWAPERPVSGLPSAREASPFSLSIADVPTKGLETLADMALRVRTPRVLTNLPGPSTETIPGTATATDTDAPSESARIAALGELANRLAREGAELGIAIDSLPATVSSIAGSGPVVRALADENADGADWIDPILVELGHRVRWWRVGGFGDSVDALAAPELAAAGARMRGLVPGGVVEAPWPTFDEIPPAAIAPGVAISRVVDPSIIPEEVPSLTDGFVRAIEAAGMTGWNRPDHTSVFRVDPGIEDGESRIRAIHEAVLNAVHAWVGFGNGDHADPWRGRSLRLDEGWSWRDGRRPQLVPNPIAAAWIPLMDALTDRNAERLERVAPGVRGVLLTPRRGAGERTEPIAVFWAEPGPERAESLTLLLSPERVVAADIFGNTTPVEATTLPSSSVRAHTIDLTGGPVFVRGVDPELLRFFSSIHLAPSLVQSNTEPQEVELRLSNAWPSAVQGEFFIVEPGNLSTGTRATQDRRWDIAPRFGSFAIAGGDGAGLPIVFDVSPAIPAGPERLVVDLDFAAPTVSDFVRIERTIEVGLDTIELHLVASFEPDPWGPDLVVYAVIENTGTTTEVVNLSVSADGYPRQRAAVSPVYPDRRTIKAFPFRDGRALLAGKPITAGLMIRERGSRLLRSITIDDGTD